jgi:hypothetical protein
LPADERGSGGAQAGSPPQASSWTLASLRRAFTWRANASEASEEPESIDLEQPAADPARARPPTIPVVAERPDSPAGERASGSARSEVESAKDGAGAAGRPAAASPVCLICLDTLASDDFASGRAISLGCNCRGDLALRHRDCAIKWAQVKDSGRGGVPTCELCQHPARNLPPLPARPRAPAGIDAPADDDAGGDAAYVDFSPSQADVMFDCVRVCWVAMIVSILFFEASLGAALWTGLIAGLAYSMMVRVMYRQHFAAMRAYAEQQVALRQPPPPAGPGPTQLAVGVV